MIPDNRLVFKYNLPVPRYTSYPTVPYWQDAIKEDAWKENMEEQFTINNDRNGISLYLHLPFCESLCTYCGCNKKITTNHKVEEEYILAIQKEWRLYRELMPAKPVIRELHIGGGTPTFFSPKNLNRLLNDILNDVIIHPQHEFSIEGHPNNTTQAHLQTLYDLGFRRISYGVQDNNQYVQKVINRIQPFENVVEATYKARKTGFTSVNFDLIYGLPFQTVDSIEQTFNEVLQLKPDRIAFYSYAHVPWTNKAQRLFDEGDLPSATQKIELYTTGRKLLLDNNYHDIGMDHFAMPHDALYKASVDGTLHRNFMGYTTQRSGMLIGLGVSAISDSGTAFAQNEKTMAGYYRRIQRNSIPVRKGYFLNGEDMIFKQYILDICCKGKAYFLEESLPILEQYSFPALQEFAEDGLVVFNKTAVKLTPEGRYFIRNIASAFDIKLRRKNISDINSRVFSSSI